MAKKCPLIEKKKTKKVRKPDVYTMLSVPKIANGQKS